MFNLKAQGVPCLTPRLLVYCLSIRATSSVDLRRSLFDVKLIRFYFTVIGKRNPIENKICGTVTPLNRESDWKRFLLFSQRCWFSSKYHRIIYCQAIQHPNLAVTASLKSILLLWLPRECLVDSVQTILWRGKIRSRQSTATRNACLGACNMFWIFFHMNNNDDKRCQTQSTCQITCKLRASSSTCKRQIRFIAGRFEKRRVWGSGQESCLAWIRPSAQNLFFLVIMEGAMTPSAAHKYGYSA